MSATSINLLGKTIEDTTSTRLSLIGRFAIFCFAGFLISGLTILAAYVIFERSNGVGRQTKNSLHRGAGRP